MSNFEQQFENPKPSNEQVNEQVAQDAEPPKTNKRMFIIIGIIIIALVFLGLVYYFFIYHDSSGLDQDEADSNTNQPKIDTDRDGLTDDEETFIYMTDPNNEDTDGDGYLDGEEIENGYDPLIDESSQLEKTAWEIYQEMIIAVENRDIDKINELSYSQMSCADAEECAYLFDFLASGYKANDQEKEIDFVNIWEDSRQVILSTNAKQTVDSDVTGPGYERKYIYFIKDDLGYLKILGVVISSWYSRNEQELQEMILDSDQDGLTDWKENCMGSNQYNPNCEKTDSQNRDTDGDGLWDGTNDQLQ